MNWKTKRKLIVQQYIEQQSLPEGFKLASIAENDT